MAFLLDGTAIKGPQSIEETNSTQYAQQRTLDGTIGRDLFGSNKRKWVLEYDNVNPSAFNTVDTIYQSYLATGTTQTWQITEANYNGYATTERLVHVDLFERSFTVRGDSYLSSFTLILTEA